MQAWHFFEGKWYEGNPPIMGPMSHGFWMASTVFDGARAFEGVAPALGLHCRRLITSAEVFGLAPPVTAEAVLEIGQEGRKKFAPDAALYIRPMMWAESGFVAADPQSTRFCFTLHESPMPPEGGFSVTKSPFIRPLPNSAPTESKAACLYPNYGRALAAARAAGYDNAVLLDALGNVAELATANIWLVKDGQAITPAPNGCFLNGITRQRIAGLLAEAGVPVIQRRVTYDELLGADELFSTGNYGKVQPIVRIDDRSLQPGPVAKKAREIYWDWALGAG